MNVKELNDRNRVGRGARPFIFANVLFFKHKSKKFINGEAHRIAILCA